MQEEGAQGKGEADPDDDEEREEVQSAVAEVRISTADLLSTRCSRPGLFCCPEDTPLRGAGGALRRDGIHTRGPTPRLADVITICITIVSVLGVYGIEYGAFSGFFSIEDG